MIMASSKEDVNENVNNKEGFTLKEKKKAPLKKAAAKAKKQSNKKTVKKKPPAKLITATIEEDGKVPAKKTTAAKKSPAAKAKKQPTKKTAKKKPPTKCKAKIFNTDTSSANANSTTICIPVRILKCGATMVTQGPRQALR